jgi:hypothetical protein
MRFSSEVITRILRHVFVAPVAVTDIRVRLGDKLALHFELHPEHAVGAGVLGAQIEDVSFFF